MAEIDIAKATLLNAQQVLSEESARVEQAKQDWVRLSNEGQASDLVLRKPQLLAAQANVQSAQAGLSKAELALERTKIQAPYTGRILSKQVDVGQVVSSGTQLAELYAVDYVEVRLPIKNKDLPYMVLPESTRFEQSSPENKPAVTIYSDLIDRQQWQGNIVRTEGAFDSSSQQLFVVAQIDDPYGVSNQHSLPIKIGQYVTANIVGKTIEGGIVIPNKTVYQGSYVYTVKENRLMRKAINIAWQNEEFALIEDGLSANELLVLTALGQVNSGTPVSISKKDDVAVQQVKKRSKQMSKKGDRNSKTEKGVVK